MDEARSAPHDALRRDRILRTALIAGGVLLGTLLLAFLIAQLLVGSPDRSRAAAIERLDAAVPRDVIADSDARPEKLATPIGFAGRTAGVALRRLGEVDSVQTADGDLRAGDGSRLIAFEVGDWPCAVPPCQDWTSLDAQVVIDGTAKDLPEGGDTYVVVVPPGTDELRLTARTDGFRQSLDLLEGTEAEDNIAFLESEDRDHAVVVNRTVTVTERTSVPLDDGTGQLRDTFLRDVTVADLDRTFFLGEETPASPRRVFLTVRVTYAYQGTDQHYLMPDDEVALEDAAGNRYLPRPLDTTAAAPRLTVEIPAALQRAELVFSGTAQTSSTTGTPYTSTLLEARLPLSFDPGEKPAG